MLRAETGRPRPHARGADNGGVHVRRSQHRPAAGLAAAVLLVTILVLYWPAPGLGAQDDGGASLRTATDAAEVDLTVAGSGLVTVGQSALTCATHCTIPQDLRRVMLLTAVPATGSSFMGWSGGCVGAAVVCGVAANGATSVTATFGKEPADIRLTVSGPGVISSEPAGISCGTAASGPPVDQCHAPSFDSGQEVLLTATPDPGSTFVGWGGICEQYATASCYVEGMPTTGVTAAFQRAVPLLPSPAPGASASLTVATSGTQLVSAPADVLASCVQATSCTATVPFGETVTLAPMNSFAVSNSSVAMPDIRWSGDCVGRWPVCKLVAEGSLTVDAMAVHRSSFFLVTGYGLNLTVGRGGAVAVVGHETCSYRNPSGCVQTFLSGTHLILSARATSDKYRFRRWQAGSQGCHGGSHLCHLLTGGGESEIAIFSRK